MRTPVLLITLFAVLASSVAFAGEPAGIASSQPKPTAGDENLIQLNFPENREAADLAKQVNTLLQEKRRVGGEKAVATGFSVTHEPRRDAA